MLSFDHKRSIFRSFPELKEVSISNGRVNYELQNIEIRRKVVARQLTTTGNGYILGTSQSTFLADERGWINIKNLDEEELTAEIRHAINELRSADLNHRCEEMLTNTGLLPLTAPTWRHFEIVHQAPVSTAETQKIKDFMDDEVGDANGLYIYTMEDGTVLYIGKAKPLKSRLWSHYQESFQPVKGDTKDNQWHRFFSSHQGKLSVRWMELEGEDLRKLMEHILTMNLKPKFLSFR